MLPERWSESPRHVRHSSKPRPCYIKTRATVDHRDRRVLLLEVLAEGHTKIYQVFIMLTE